MSEVKVNKISPRTACGTVTLGDSGDTFTIPSGATITNNGTQTGFGRTGTVDWVTTPKVTGDSPITAVTGEGYFLNTTAGTITVNLPAGAAGSIVSMADYAATWHTYNVTVAPNGAEKIGGIAADATLDTQGQSVTFVYIDGTQGWINVQDSTSNVRGAIPYPVATGGNAVVTCGNFKTHIFTAPGTFCVACAATCTSRNVVDYVVVAGGGGGPGIPGAGDGGGGSAGGGFRIFSTAPGCNSPLNNSGASPNTEVTITASPYPITVGAGGTVPGSPPWPGTSGANSIFSTVTSAGGGAGGYIASAGIAGGSGGGGGGGNPSPGPGPGGAGNTPPVSPSQGNAGGQGGGGSPNSQSGGGGGAGAAGGNNPGPASGNGGAGSYIADPFVGPTAPSYGTPGPVGSTRYFAGGGGGAGRYDGGSGSDGGGGAGSSGTSGPPQVATDGTVNTGGGGGGGSDRSVSGAGGSGIVMIRYRYQ